MNAISVRIGAAASALLFAGLLAAPAALADSSCTISDNGARSRNRCKIKTQRTVTRVTTNTANITNGVSVTSNTGDNKANSNTAGDVNVESGNSTVTVTITNSVSQ